MIIDSQYKVIEKFGEDAWAFTYKVKDIRSEKIYALKLFKKIGPRELYKKFHAKDMHHITKMHHPNLVDVETFGNEGNSIYYLNEYFPGIPLTEFELTSRNQQELYDIIVQICYGLETIYSQNIIHRNIKPSNILFKKTDSTIEVKLLDYGFIATEEKARKKKSKSEHLYIAPEILAGETSSIQSDLYALGVTLYRVLTGEYPYTQTQIHIIAKNPRISLIPQFPRELNRKISDEIESIILKLLEINPKNRYQDPNELIAEINEIQPKEYKISEEWTIINRIIINGYVAREKYANDLLDILDSEEYKNRVISIYSKDGMGKQNTLSLFRFHLLTGKYFIFDYTCSEENQDPFFSLIKEFKTYLKTFDFEKNALSKKFRKFLFGTDFDLYQSKDTDQSLYDDFENAKKIIQILSQKKPLLFIIRYGEYLKQDSINFINYVKDKLKDSPFYILIGTKNRKTVSMLNSDVNIELQPLTLKDTKRFVFHLIHKRLPETFVQELWDKTKGIPRFIKFTLVDLIKNGKIWKDGVFNFKISLRNYKLHEELRGLLKRRIEVMENDIPELRGLSRRISVANMTLTKDLILAILDDIDENKYYFFVKSCIEYEVLVQKSDIYEFAFDEMREDLYNECSSNKIREISLKIIDYYENMKNIDFETLTKLAITAEAAKFSCKVRQYRRKLYQHYKNQQDYYRAFLEICNVILIDYSDSCNVSRVDLVKDLNFLLESAEITGSIKQAVSLVNFNIFPDIFEKFYILGYFYLNLDEYKKSQMNLEKAKLFIHTGLQRIRVTLTEISLNIRLNNLNKIGELLDSLDEKYMPIEYLVSYIDKKSTYLNKLGHPIQSIKFVLDFLPKVHSTNDYFTIMNLGSLYNNLAITHVGLNNLKEANEYYQKAQSLWNSINHKRPLPILHNNLGDLSLKQGDINTAMDHFEKALNLSILLQQPRSTALAYLNYGEMYNKMGEYDKADEFLEKARILAVKLNNIEFLKSVNHNKAILYLKSKSFGEYYQLIQKIDPFVCQNRIDKITPLTKTFFFYLLATGQIKRIKWILHNNAIDFFNTHNEEFYHQIKWTLNDTVSPEERIDNFKKSLIYAEKDKNEFAITILHMKLITFYLQINKIDKAYKHYNKASILAEKNHYKYWKIQIKLMKIELDLTDRTMSKRLMVRELLGYLNEIEENNYYQLKTIALEILIQISNNLSLTKLAQQYFLRYKDHLERISDKLPKEDKRSLLLSKKYFTKKINAFNTVKIQKTSEIWTSERKSLINKLLTLTNPDRIEFHISKIIKEIFPANSFAVAIYNEKNNRYSNLCTSKQKLSQKLDFHQIYIDEALKSDKIVLKTINSNHLLYLPLGSTFMKIGCLIIADNGEYEYQKNEIKQLEMLRLPLTTILVRIKDILATQEDERMMKHLIKLGYEFSYIKDLSTLGEAILKASIKFVKASRGILIRRNIHNNHVYKAIIDKNGIEISNPTNINKTLFMIAEETKSPQYMVSSYQDIITAYAFPIYVKHSFFGTFYLDTENEKSELKINEKYMKMFIDSITFLISQTSFYNEIQNKSKEVSHFDELKRKFVSIVSHELNTPLTAMKKNIVELKNEFSEKSILDLENKLSSFSSKVKDISIYQKYLTSNSKDLLFEKIDVIELIQSQINNIVTRLPESRVIHFKTAFGQNLSYISGDSEAIGIAIFSLIHNAVRHSINNSTIIIGAKHSNFEEEEIDGQDTIVISIEDKGDGFAESKNKYIASSFYEGNDIVSHRSGDLDFHSCSFGLGLSTVYRIIELHQAKIWYKSEPMKGTTFFMAFPILRA